MTDFPALMAAIDEADAKLKKCGVERRARQEQLDASITAEAIAAAQATGLHMALALIDVEAKPQPEKPKRVYTRRNKGATVPSASELPAQHRHDGRVEPSNTGAGAPLAINDESNILPRARA